MVNNFFNFVLNKEKLFFYFFLLLNIALLFNSTVYPSVDGPAHLHNSYLLKQVVGGSDFLNNYFTVNSIFIPNWISHAFMSISMVFVSPFLAEKLFFIFYIVATSFSFRYLIKNIAPENVFGANLIFPFLYTFLLLMGFYNFSISIAFFFFSVGFYIKNKDNLNIKNALILAFLFTLTYFSNILTFAYTLFFVGSIGFMNSLKINEGLNKRCLTFFGKHALKLFAISLLPLILLVLFYVSVNFNPYDKQYSFEDITDWIFNIKCLILFEYNKDKFYTNYIFLILIASFAITGYRYIKETKNLLTTPLLVFIIFIINAVLVVVVPDGASAGMMTDRLVVLFFIFLLMLFLAMPIAKDVLVVSVFLILAIQFRMYFKTHKDIQSELSLNAEKMHNASNSIKEHSVVLPINMSDNWFDVHLSNYLGIDKELVILENYEANVGWFPLKWNLKQMPKLMLGSKSNLNNSYWISNNESVNEKKIDYVVLYGNVAKLNQPEFSELKTELSNFYVLENNFNDEHISIYTLK